MLSTIYYGWWVVLACFIINLYVGGIIFFSFTAFFEPIQREFGWSYTQISIATSLRGLEMGIFAPIVGFLVDRFGFRKLLLGGSVIIGIGLVVLSFTQSLLMFYLCFLLIALGAGGCTSVVTLTAVAVWFRKNVGLAMGIMASGFGAGGLIVPLVVFLIDACGWRLTLVILGAGMWLLGIPLSLIVRDRPEHVGLSPEGLGPESSQTTPEGERPVSTTGAFVEMIKRRSFLYLNIAETVRMMAVTAVVIHMMPYLSSLGIPRSTSGAVAAALPLVSIAGRFGFGWWGDRFDKRIVMAATFFMMSAGAFAFCYVHSTGILLLFLLLFAPGFGGSMVLRGSILQEYFGMAYFGKMIGIVMGSASIGGIIGPTLAGWAFDTIGSYTLVWYGLCGISGAAIFLIMKIKPAVSASGNVLN
ncbi:MAG: MFS transporter [Desulfobacteraceae bacterium]|nr:MAG: MFS transporter [Desulfobacteraceae bacterium]